MDDDGSGVIQLDRALRALHEGTGRGVRVAVIDSGIEISHPRLSGLTLRDDIHVVDAGLHVEARPGNGTDLFGHGTAVASIIRSIAPEAEIGSVRVLGEHLDSRTAIIREGVRQAFDRGYAVLNCSFGCGLPQHIFQCKEWVDEAYLHGVHIVSACNNDDFSKPEWPGYFPSVITVNMARVADYHRFYYKPGNLVEFAAPVFSGLLARLLSVFPKLRPLEAKSILLRAAAPWTADIAAPNVRG